MLYLQIDRYTDERVKQLKELCKLSVPYFAKLPEYVLSEIAFCMQEIQIKNNNPIVQKDGEFPGILFVYSGSLTVEAVTYGGATHCLEILYTNCAYGIYQAA